MTYIRYALHSDDGLAHAKPILLDPRNGVCGLVERSLLILQRHMEYTLGIACWIERTTVSVGRV